MGSKQFATSLRAIPVAAALTLVLAVWAVLAFLEAQSVGQTSWDDECYAAQPVYAVTQAVVALIGIAAGSRGLAALAGWARDGASGRKLFGVAVVALLIWLILAFVFGDADWIPCPGEPRGLR